MKQLTLKRLGDNGKQTVGELIAHDGNGNVYLKLNSIEASKSICAEGGKYTCRKYYSLQYGMAFQILNCDERKIYAGYFNKDMKGICPGSALCELLDGQYDVVNSRLSIKNLLREMPDEFPFEIIPVPEAMYLPQYLN